MTKTSRSTVVSNCTGESFFLYDEISSLWDIPIHSEAFGNHAAEKISEQSCRGHLLGQNFVSSDRGRGPLQDEDHSGSRPHSFPGLYLMRSGCAPEWFPSGSRAAL